MRHMPCGDVPACTGDVFQGIIEKDVRAKRLQKRPLVAAAEEQCLVETHAPLAQRQNHPLVRRGRAGGDQRGADWRVLRWKSLLQSMQCREKALERASRQG